MKHSIILFQSIFQSMKQILWFGDRLNIKWTVNVKFYVVYRSKSFHFLRIYFVFVDLNAYQIGELPSSCSEYFESLIRNSVLAQVNYLKIGEIASSCCKCFEPLISDLVIFELNLLQICELTGNWECFQSFVSNLIAFKVNLFQIR